MYIEAGIFIDTAAAELDRSAITNYQCELKIQLQHIILCDESRARLLLHREIFILYTSMGLVGIVQSVM